VNQTIAAVSTAIEQATGHTISTSILLQRARRAFKIQRPIEPRYQRIYDCDQVFMYLNAQDNTQLDELQLRDKAIMLLKLDTGWRSDDLTKTFRDPICMQLTETALQIRCYWPKDQYYKRGSFSEWVTVQATPTLPNICTVSTITQYISRTQQHAPVDKSFTFKRKVYNTCSIFITTPTEHKAVASLHRDTIANTTVRVLAASGIDTEVYKAHSTRHAFVSKAMANGVPELVIARQARFKSSATLKKWYLKQLPHDAATYAQGTVQNLAMALRQSFQPNHK